jgi:hypothetical protein
MLLVQLVCTLLTYALDDQQPQNGGPGKWQSNIDLAANQVPRRVVGYHYL